MLPFHAKSTLPQPQCFSQCCIAMKRHHQDHDVYYRRKHLFETYLQFQRYGPLSSWKEAWQHVGSHGLRKVGESSISKSMGSRDSGHGLKLLKPLNPTLNYTLPLEKQYLLQQGLVPLKYCHSQMTKYPIYELSLPGGPAPRQHRTQREIHELDVFIWGD